MKLKTYRAATMAEALTAVKKELGKDAVILHTRTVKVGGLLGLGARTVVEMTASDEPLPTTRRAPAQNRPKADPNPSPAPATAPAAPILAAMRAYQKSTAATPTVAALPDLPIASSLSAPASPPASKPAPVSPAVPVSPTVMPVRERRPESPQTELKPAVDPLAAAPRPVTAPRRPITGEDDIRRELADIKLLVNQVLHSSPATSAGVAAGAMPEALFKHYLRLLESSVSRDIADSIVGSVRDELTPTELHDESIVRTTILRHIADLIPVGETIARPKGHAGPLVVALIGPTGVGKTTTIAKLAASYKLRHGKSVALITSDTYRIAAVDQLRTYAGIIGLTLKVVLTPQEMAQAVASLSNHDVILIDTAGRSQFNADRLVELQEFLTAAGPTETHLVLSTTASEQVLLKTAESFAPLRPSRVILTKLDEAVNFGVIVNVARRLNTQLSFITTGQEVPDDIEQSHPDRLARLVLENSLAPSSNRRAETVREPALAGARA